jgi:hypothetical protein
VEWVVREGVGAWGRNDPTLVCTYKYMNNKTIKKELEISAKILFTKLIYL